MSVKRYQGQHGLPYDGEWIAASDYDAQSLELQAVREALGKLPAADVTGEALADAVRFYTSMAHLTKSAEELKTALLYRNVLGTLYASLPGLRAALKQSRGAT